MLKELLTECTTFWNLYFTQQKEVECVFTFLCLIRKCSVKKILALIFSSLALITSFLFLSTPNVYSVDVKLQWNESPEIDIAGYRIFCREENKNYNYNNPVWEGTDTACIISGLIEDKVYFFVVRSFDTHGLESKNSNEKGRYPVKDFSIKGSDPFTNKYNKIYDKSNNDLYTNQDACTSGYEEDKKLKIEIYNKYTGNWSSFYKFFQKTCGKKIQFYDNGVVFYVKDENELTRYLR